MAQAWSGPVAKYIRKTIVNGRKVYRVQMGSRGKGNRRSKVCETLEAALAVKQQWATEGIPQSNAPAAPPEAEPTVEDGLRDYGADLVRRGKNPERVLYLLPVLRRQYPEFLAHPLAEVSIDDLWAFRRHREAAGVKPNTIITDLRALRSAFRLARGSFVVPQDVFPAEDLTRVRELTPMQLRTALLATPEPFRTIAQLAPILLMRQGDFLTLTRSMIQWSEGVIQLPRTKKGPRQVAVGAVAMTLLRAQCARHAHELVFPKPNGKRWSRCHVTGVWRRACRAAGRPDFTFHDLKHHGAMRALADGASFPELQALLHHKDPRMVNRYATATSTRLRAIQDRISMAGR